MILSGCDFLYRAWVRHAVTSPMQSGLRATEYGNIRQIVYKAVAASLALKMLSSNYSHVAVVSVTLNAHFWAET